MSRPGLWHLVRAGYYLAFRVQHGQAWLWRLKSSQPTNQSSPYRLIVTAKGTHLTDNDLDRGRQPDKAISGYTKRARAETAMSRFKQVIGDGLRSHTDERRATEVDIAVHVLNRVPELGRPNSVSIA